MIEIAIDCSQNSSMALKAANGVFRLDNLDFGRASDCEFLPCLRQFLAEHNLSVREVEGWTVGIGPGSFAGIRFALALVKGICTATAAKARGINSSFAIAASLKKDGRIAVLQNARCGKVFVSVYECHDGKCISVEQPAMLEPTSEWPSWADADIFCTPDDEIKNILPVQIAEKLQNVQPAVAFDLLDASADDWPWLDSPDIEPLYVRPPA